MSLLRRLFNPAFRRARAAEADGDYRRAARLYVEADAPGEAANALLLLAVRSQRIDDRLAAYEGALRWLEPGSPRARRIEARMGSAILEDAQQHGLPDARARARLREGARRLERARLPEAAATAWELLGELDEAARCLTQAGEVDRLEALLGERGEAEAHRDALRRHLDDYRLHLGSGARRAAEAALEEARLLAPQDEAVRDALAQLRSRRPPPWRVTVAFRGPGTGADGDRVTVIGRLPATLGRGGAEVDLRGLGISRRHAAIDRPPADPESGDGGFRLRDLGSRNGTLVAGVALGAPLLIQGPQRVALGSDVELALRPAWGERPPALGAEAPARGAGDGAERDAAPGADATVLSVTVSRGPDRGRRFWLLAPGTALGLPGGSGRLRFPEALGGVAVFEPARPLLLGGQRVATPVELLVGDTLKELGEAPTLTIEVVDG